MPREVTVPVPDIGDFHDVVVIEVLVAPGQQVAVEQSLVTLESTGVALIYGRDEVAIEAAQRLADRLDITVLLTRPGDVTPRRTNEFPVLKGTIRNARGHLGQFELAIDDYALPQPSSRAKLVFGSPRDGAANHILALRCLTTAAFAPTAQKTQDSAKRNACRIAATLQDGGMKGWLTARNTSSSSHRAECASSAG